MHAGSIYRSAFSFLKRLTKRSGNAQSRIDEYLDGTHGFIANNDIEEACESSNSEFLNHPIPEILVIFAKIFVGRIVAQPT